MSRTQFLIVAILALLLAAATRHAIADSPPASAAVPCSVPRPVLAPRCGCYPAAILVSPPTAAPAAESAVPEEITRITTLAIEAAKNDAENTKDTYETFAKFLAGGLSLATVLLGVLGWKTLRDAVLPYKRDAKRLRDEFEADLKNFREELNVERRRSDALTSDNIAATDKLGRASVLWEDNKRDQSVALYREALPILNRIIEQTRGTKENRVLTWGLSSRAQAQYRLNDLLGAEATEREALELALKMRAADQSSLPEARIAEKYYNLACYQCLNDNKTGCLENLRRALEIDPKSLVDAQRDAETGDLKRLDGDPDFRKLVPRRPAVG